jgi:hypothetical protein
MTENVKSKDNSYENIKEVIKKIKCNQEKYEKQKETRSKIKAKINSIVKENNNDLITKMLDKFKENQKKYEIEKEKRNELKQKINSLLNKSLKEIWKSPPVELNLMRYEVSNLGRVRTVNNGRILNSKPRKTGYIELHLTDDDGDRKFMFQHRFVAYTFLENPDNLPQVNHKDFNRSNNVVSNLEWSSVSHNNNHKLQNKNRKNTTSRSRKVIQKSKDGEIIEIFDSAKEASKKTGVSVKNIQVVALGVQKTAGGYIWEYTDDKIENEEWSYLEIDDTEIEISDQGRIKHKNGHKSFGCLNNDGYYTTDVNGKSKKMHRLVMMAFEPIDDMEDYQVDHIDRNTKNNKLENLRWATASENVKNRTINENTFGTSRPINCYDANGNCTKFKSMRLLCRELNVSHTYIRKSILNKEFNKKLGYLFEYADLAESDSDSE